ncbi:hypothetical protein SXHG_00044, partial [Synechococcus phage MRHenn-2013a]
MAPQNKWFAASPNTDYIYKALTDGTVAKLTGGRIPTMNAAQAAGLVGSWLIETGRKDLRNLDVVEAGTGRGRGLSQYTGVRRTPYDKAVKQARAAGQDPNSAQWQIKYFAQEYMNKDLIGWTKVFEKMPKNLKTPGEYAKYFTGSAAEGKGYFRPGVPHTDRRMQAADEVFRHYAAPNRQAPANRPAPAGTPAIKPGPLKQLMNRLGIRGQDQGFAIDKLSRNLGSIAAAPNAGRAIFNSIAPGGNSQWKSLSKADKQAWNTAAGQIGAQFGIAINPPTRNIGLPTKTNVGVNQSFGPKPVNLTIRGVQPGDLGYGTNNTRVGGLPGLREVAQAGIHNYNWKPDKNWNSYTNPHYNVSRSSVHNRAGSNLRGSGGLSTSSGAYSGLSVGGYGSGNSAYRGGSVSYGSGSVATGTGMGSISRGAG